MLYIYGNHKSFKPIHFSSYGNLKVILETTSRHLSFSSFIMTSNIYIFVIFNWDSFHARLNSHYKTWSYKKKKHKNIKAYLKSLWKEPTVNKCLLILDLNPFRLYVKRKHSIGREFQSIAVQGKRLLT